MRHDWTDSHELLAVRCVACGKPLVPIFNEQPKFNEADRNVDDCPGRPAPVDHRCIMPPELTDARADLGTTKEDNMASGIAPKGTDDRTPGELQVDNYQESDSTIDMFAAMDQGDLRAEVMRRPLSVTLHLLEVIREVRREQQNRIEAGHDLESRLRALVSESVSMETEAVGPAMKANR